MRDSAREMLLAAALVEASDTLSEGFDTEGYLERLSDHCVEILEARAAGIMVIDSGKTVTFAASSRGRTMALDLLAVQHDGGPCLDSYGTGKPVPPVSIRVAHAAARWPQFTERALRHDIAATFAVPLRRRETLLGALNVFVPALPAHHSSPEDEWSVRLAQALADGAAVGLHNHRAYTQYRTLSDQLQQALSSRVRIEQAKGMLAERWQTRADEAFMTLRQYARRHRLPLDQVATAVIEGSMDGEILRGGLPPSPPPSP